MASVPTFIWSVVGIVLTPTSLKLNILSSSVKLLSEGLKGFHIIFTVHVNSELIGGSTIRIDFHNIVVPYRYNIPHFPPFVQGKAVKKCTLAGFDTKLAQFDTKTHFFPSETALQLYRFTAITEAFFDSSNNDIVNSFVRRIYHNV
jgi:hypothetical protein